MKYIIVATYGIPVAIIFDEMLNHKEVAGEMLVKSAGFCNKDGLCWEKV